MGLPVFEGPNNKDRSILESLVGPPMSGNYHMYILDLNVVRVVGTLVRLGS